MEIRCVWEHNGNDTILYSDNFIGAFTRGKTKEIALEKCLLKSYLTFNGKESRLPTVWSRLSFRRNPLS